MTAFTDITNSQIDADSPVTQPLMTALRDNTPATAEGSSGAPVVATGWHPYDMVSVGDGNDGLIYDHSVDGATTTVTSPTLEDGYEYMIRLDGIVHPATGVERIDFEAKTPSGSFFNVAVFSCAPNVAVYGDMIYRSPRITRNFAEVYGGVHDGTTFFAGGSAVLGSPDILDQVQFQSQASMTAGRIYLLRRREYASG